MNEADLDTCYTAVCRALGEVGPARSELFLAMLNLALLTRMGAAQDVLPLIEAARTRALADEQGRPEQT